MSRTQTLIFPTLYTPYQELWAQRVLLSRPMPILSKTLGTEPLVSLPHAHFIESFGYRAACFLAPCPFYRKLWVQRDLFPSAVGVLCFESFQETSSPHCVEELRRFHTISSLTPHSEYHPYRCSFSGFTFQFQFGMAFGDDVFYDGQA